MRSQAALFGLLCVVRVLPAQDGTIRVETRLVQITAVVRDRHGAVATLTKNDFEVQDKGKMRTIAFFGVSRASDHIPSSSLPPNVFTNKLDHRGNPPVAATVVLFDQLNTQVSDQSYARK